MDETGDESVATSDRITDDGPDAATTSDREGTIGQLLRDFARLVADRSIEEDELELLLEPELSIVCFR